MQLPQFRVGVPIYEIHSVVGHLTPRIPTTIEKMVLRLLVAAEAHPMIGELTFHDAFEGMLGVPDADILLAPCLDELCFLKVLQAPEQEKPTDAPISSWHLSNQGRDFWDRGLLPRREAVEDEAHWYDPISGKLHSRQEATWRPDPGTSICLDQSPPQIDLGALIREALLRQRPAWYKPNTEITRVDPSIESIQWRSEALIVKVAVDGNLTLACPGDAALDEWLRTTQPEVVWEWVVAPALQEVRLPPGRHACDIGLEDIVAVSRRYGDVNPIDSRRQNPIWSLEVDVGDELESAQTRLRTDLLQIDASASLRPFSETPYTATLDNAGLCVRFSGKFGRVTGLRQLQIPGKDALPRVWLNMQTRIYWGGQARTVTWLAEASPSRSQSIWLNLKTELHRWLGWHAPVSHLPLAVWTDSIEVAVTRWIDQSALLDWKQWLHDLAIFLNAVRDRLGNNVVIDDQGWASPLKAACSDRINDLRRVLNLSEGIEVLESLLRLPIAVPDLTREVIRRITPRDTVREMRELRAVLNDSELVFPGDLLSEQLREEMLRGYLERQPPQDFGPHEFTNAFMRFRKTCDATLGAIPRELLESPLPERHPAMRRHPVKTLRAIDQLEPSLCAILAELELPDASASDWLKRLRTLRESMHHMLAQPFPEGRRAIVLDTNVLMNEPGFLDKMRSSDKAVISRAVIEELDGLKKPPPEADTAKQDRAALAAREATRRLKAATDQIHFEGSRREQCAADLPATRDNEILAVAVHHALSNAVLITSDNNLRLTASSIGVPSQTPSEYLGTYQAGRNATPQPNRKPRR